MRKVLFVSLVSALYFGHAHAETKIKPADLVGIWEAYGYTCVGQVPLEIIEISAQDNHLTAMKIEGDDCVPSGHKTWEGEMNNDKISVNFYVSSGPNTEIYKSSSKSLLTVVDIDTIQVEGGVAVSFKRQPDLPEDDGGLHKFEEPSR